MTEEEKVAGRIEIRDFILAEYDKSNIVVAGIEVPQVMPLAEFITQPVEGMLYDLNRSEEVVLTFITDHRWVNNYAVAKTIRALKGEIDRLSALVDVTASAVRLEEGKNER